MNTNNTPAPPPQEWGVCAPGEIVRLGKKLRGRKTRREFLRASVVTAASLLAAGGGLWVALGRREQPEYDFGGIACTEVIRQGKEYMAGQVEESVRSRITAHVAKCPRCGPLFEQMREQMDKMG